MMQSGIMWQKLKTVFPVFMVVFTVSLLLLLFVFKDKLNQWASTAVKAQAGETIQAASAITIDSLYNYATNGLNYHVTFLEFGAMGCSACKRMEKVMDEIAARYPDSVYVIFLNILTPKNQQLMKYYGVAAIPTQVLLDRNGIEFFRHTGFYYATDLQKVISAAKP